MTTECFLIYLIVENLSFFTASYFQRKALQFLYQEFESFIIEI
jgi:hypothetical protein